MTGKQFVALGVRLFCVWLAIYILSSVPAYWSRASQRDTSAAFIAACVVLAILALIVVLLWLFPLAVARKLLARSAQEQPIALAAHEQIEHVGFCLMGLWLLTHAIPGLVLETFLLFFSNRYGSTFHLLPQNYAFIAEHVVQLALADGAETLARR